MVQESKFIKYRDCTEHHKPYNSDLMNKKGTNLKRLPPDMMEYWNFSLSDEVISFTRQKYTWLDNCAFIGGTIDFILILLYTLFYFYNYKIAEFNVYY